ncbi:MAG: SMC-Scp complex subunit ScpB [bacterium]|nr:SMC-Scp complex subunit ScpB [bacterium]
MTDPQEIEAAIEAALFVTPQPIRRRKILEVFGARAREEASAALERVLARYRADANRGVVVEEVASGLRLVTRPELHGYLRKLFEITGQNRLSMPALETLAIIAYRQPVTGPEIQELRSVSSSGVLRTLLEKRLIRIAGRKLVVGKPFLYATTREFLMHFGLKSLDDLPPLEEFEETFGQMATIEADVLPFEERASTAESVSGESPQAGESGPAAAEPETPEEG